MEFLQKIQYLTCNDFSISGSTEDEMNLYNAAKAFLLSDEKRAVEYAKALYDSTEREDMKQTASGL